MRNVRDALLILVGVLAMVTARIMFLKGQHPVIQYVDVPSPTDWRQQAYQRLTESPSWPGHTLAVGTQDGAELVLFWDYECVSCRAAASAVDSFVLRHPEMSVKVMHLPLHGFHATAVRAAIAATCAAEQGRFAAYHAILVSPRRSVLDTNWVRFSQDARIERPAAFRKCLVAARSLQHVQSHVQLAQELHIPGVPVFVGPNDMYAGIPNIEILEELVEARHTPEEEL